MYTSFDYLQSHIPLTTLMRGGSHRRGIANNKWVTFIEKTRAGEEQRRRGKNQSDQAYARQARSPDTPSMHAIDLSPCWPASRPVDGRR